MAKLGTKKNPTIVRVKTEERGQYVAQVCEQNGWQYIIDFEGAEDILDLEKALNPPQPAQSAKFGRNDPCPCGSGKNIRNAAVQAKAKRIIAIALLCHETSNTSLQGTRLDAAGALG